MLSVVVLAWDQLPLTQRCVASLRATTDVDHELVLVDNGSAPDAAAWARDAADVPVLLPENTGFARGMNAGLAAASGDVVAFVNNDTVWSEDWTGPLLEHFAPGHRVGIVAPAVTAAGNPTTVRDAPSDEVVVLDPFSCLPSGVVYLMDTTVARQLGGFPTRYRTAMSEDVDLCFTCWANGLDVVVDARVLVEHDLHGTMDAKLGDQRALWRENLDRFLEVWTTADPDDVARLPDVDDDAFAANLRHARAAATWLARLDEERQAHRSQVVELRQQLQAARSSTATPRPTLARRVARRLRRALQSDS